MPPGSHGILGFVTAVPGEQDAAGEDRSLNHVQWGDDPDPGTWQARRTVFEQAADAGVAVTAVGPYAYAGSGLTRAVYRGANYSGSVSHGDLTALVLAALATAPRSLVYGYLPDLDLTGHVRGVDSAAWRAQLQLIDRVVEQLRRRPPGRRRPAGHRRPRDARRPGGHPADLDRHPELADGVRLLVGEPRARYVHAEPARLPTCWTAGGASSASGRGWPPGRRRSPAASSGPSTTPWPPRSATSSLWRGARWALVTPEREPGPSRLAAFHGSLTATELAIPLLAARGAALE